MCNLTVTLTSGDCSSVGITAAGQPFTGYGPTEYITIEEVNLNPTPSTDTIPHPQETVFNTQSFYHDEVTLDSGVAYAWVRTNLYY